MNEEKGKYNFHNENLVLGFFILADIIAVSSIHWSYFSCVFFSVEHMIN